MRKIRNNIITISGEPRTGKTTAAMELKKLYEELGYTVEFVDIGREFKKRSRAEYLKMYPDRVNVTDAEIQADETFAETIKRIDCEMDNWTREQRKIINSKSRPNTVYIFVSRLAWYFMRDEGKDEDGIYSVYMIADKEVAGERAFATGKYSSKEEATEDTEKRKQLEIERFKEKPGVDMTDTNNFNAIIDTTNLSPRQAAKTIQVGQKAYMERFEEERDEI